MVDDCMASALRQRKPVYLNVCCNLAGAALPLPPPPPPDCTLERADRRPYRGCRPTAATSRQGVQPAARANDAASECTLRFAAASVRPQPAAAVRATGMGFLMCTACGAAGRADAPHVRGDVHSFQHLPPHQQQSQPGGGGGGGGGLPQQRGQARPGCRRAAAHREGHGRLLRFPLPIPSLSGAHHRTVVLARLRLRIRCCAAPSALARTSGALYESAPGSCRRQGAACAVSGGLVLHRACARLQS